MLSKLGPCLVPVLLVALPASAAPGDNSQATHDPMMFEGAALVNLSISSADPCVVGAMVLEVQDLVSGSDPVHFDHVTYLAFTVNICTGEWLHSVGANAEPIGEADFDYSHGHDVGDLTVTLPGLDWVTLTETPVALDFHWRSSRGLGDPSFSVVGTLTTAEFEIVLDDSITWYGWGSELGDAWAGMWPCRIASNHTPTCLGQATWPPPHADPR